MKYIEIAGSEMIVMPLTQYEETLPSFEGKVRRRYRKCVELAKMTPFTLPQHASSTEQYATAAKRKFRTQFKTKPPGDTRISWKRCFSTPESCSRALLGGTIHAVAFMGRTQLSLEHLQGSQGSAHR
jgi:hypothetical protein